MISFIGNRPALQIGSYQVVDYDLMWLEAALRRAATAADHDDFPLISEIRHAVELYLENGCALSLLHLEDLFERMRKMLVEVGCGPIAEKLEPLAPPVKVSLVRAARDAGFGFEIGFFETVRSELAELREAGAEEIHFTGLRASALILRGCEEWNKSCEGMLDEIKNFIIAADEEQSHLHRVLRLSVEG